MGMEDVAYVLAYWGGAWMLLSLVGALGLFIVGFGAGHLYMFFDSLLRKESTAAIALRKHGRRSTDNISLRTDSSQKRKPSQRESGIRTPIGRRLLHRKVI